MILLKAFGVDVDTCSVIGRMKKILLCPKCVEKTDVFLETLRSHEDPTIKCPQCGGEEFHESRKYFRNSAGGFSKGSEMYTCDWCTQSFTTSEFVRF